MKYNTDKQFQIRKSFSKGEHLIFDCNDDIKNITFKELIHVIDTDKFLLFKKLCELDPTTPENLKYFKFHSNKFTTSMIESFVSEWKFISFTHLKVWSSLEKFSFLSSSFVKYFKFWIKILPLSKKLVLINNVIQTRQVNKALQLPTLIDFLWHSTDIDKICNFIIDLQLTSLFTYCKKRYPNCLYCVYVEKKIF
jgi:hypothetical protein